MSLRSAFLGAAALAALSIPGTAFGQGAVLQGSPWVAGHVPIYTSGGQSQAVIVDGGVANGGNPGANAAEFNLTQQGTPGSPFGTPFCINDAPTTPFAGAPSYHQLCLGANSRGGGLLSYNPYGLAAPLPFNFILNGQTYQFPFSTSGVIGPNPTVINDIALWNNTVGTLLSDSGVQLNQLALLTGATFTGPVAATTLATSGNPTISTSPTGNPTGGTLLSTFSTLVSQGTTSNASNREYAANIGLVSNLGFGVAHNNGDKVGLYVGAVGQSGTGDLWATNFLLAQNASSGNYTAQVIEVDLNNFDVDKGGLDGATGLPTFAAYGVSISGAADGNNYTNTAGLNIDSFGGATGTVPLFAHGIIVSGFYEFNEFAEYSQAPTVFALFGGHTYGLDCYNGVISGGCVRLATNPSGGIIGRNAANTADANVLRFDGTNTFVCETHCSGLFVNGPINPSTSAVYSIGGPSALWNTIYAQTLSASTALLVGGASTFAGTVQATALSGGSPATYACFDASGFLVSSAAPC